jgi:hypothetical protein
LLVRFLRYLLQLTLVLSFQLVIGRLTSTVTLMLTTIQQKHLVAVQLSLVALLHLVMQMATAVHKVSTLVFYQLGLVSLVNHVKMI